MILHLFHVRITTILTYEGILHIFTRLKFIFRVINPIQTQILSLLKMCYFCHPTCAYSMVQPKKDSISYIFLLAQVSVLNDLRFDAIHTT